MTKQHRGPPPSFGFSLVEICLAILVTGIGLLTVFSLFPAGLSMNQKAIDETRAALFAEEVLNGYRARIDMSTNEWAKMGADFPPGFEAVASGMWLNWGQGITVRVTSVSTPIIYKDWDGIIQNALRYTLTFSDVVPNRIKCARLRVWNGEFASGDPVDFYTEFYNSAMPP